MSTIHTFINLVHATAENASSLKQSPQNLLFNIELNEQSIGILKSIIDIPKHKRVNYENKEDKNSNELSIKAYRCYVQLTQQHIHLFVTDQQSNQDIHGNNYYRGICSVPIVHLNQKTNQFLNQSPLSFAFNTQRFLELIPTQYAKQKQLLEEDKQSLLLALNNVNHDTDIYLQLTSSTQCSVTQESSSTKISSEELGEFHALLKKFSDQDANDIDKCARVSFELIQSLIRQIDGIKDITYGVMTSSCQIYIQTNMCIHQINLADNINAWVSKFGQSNTQYFVFDPHLLNALSLLSANFVNDIAFRFDNGVIYITAPQLIYQYHIDINPSQCFDQCEKSIQSKHVIWIGDLKQAKNQIKQQLNALKNSVTSNTTLFSMNIVEHKLHFYYVQQDSKRSLISTYIRTRSSDISELSKVLSSYQIRRQDIEELLKGSQYAKFCIYSQVINNIEKHFIELTPHSASQFNVLIELIRKP